MQDDVLLRLNEAHVSMTAVLRALKREEYSLYNCVASIVDDALFVQQASQHRRHRRHRRHVHCRPAV